MTQTISRRQAVSLMSAGLASSSLACGTQDGRKDMVLQGSTPLPPDSCRSSDEWRASVRTVGGVPVAIIDVTIRRTLLVEPDQLPTIREGLDASGLRAARLFADQAQQVPSDQRHLTVAPWTIAEKSRIGLRPFAEVVRVFEDRTCWRIEGDSTRGFVGYLNLSGIDKRIDLSPARLPEAQRRVRETVEAARSDHDAGRLNRVALDVIEFICNHMNNDILKAQECYEMRRAMDRELERQAQEREVKERAQISQRELDAKYGQRLTEW